MQTVIFTKIIFSQKITDKFDTLEIVLNCLPLHKLIIIDLSIVLESYHGTSNSALLFFIFNLCEGFRMSLVSDG